MNGKASQKNTFRKFVFGYLFGIMFAVCCSFRARSIKRLSFFAGFVDTPLLPGSFGSAWDPPKTDPQNSNSGFVAANLPHNSNHVSKTQGLRRWNPRFMKIQRADFAEENFDRG